MFLVYMAVRKVEKDAMKYTFASYTNSKKKKMEISRRVMMQGILYSVTLTSLCLTFILTMAISELDTFYILDILGSVIFPMHGFWNCLIYMIPLFRQIIKNRCKSQQNVLGSIQDHQSTSKTCWLATRLNKFWIRRRTSKESKGSSSEQVEEVQDESKRGENLEGGNDGVGVYKMNSKQKDQIMDVNLSSELDHRKTVKFKEIKGEDSNTLNSSSLMLSCVEQQEEVGEPLYQNYELKKEERSQLDYFSVLEEVNAEGYDNIDHGDNNNSDNESYVDDYLKMMETE